MGQLSVVQDAYLLLHYFEINHGLIALLDLQQVASLCKSLHIDTGPGVAGAHYNAAFGVE